MMILAYLIQSSLQWRGVEVRIKMAVPNEDAARGAMTNLQELLGEMRTGAIPEVVVIGERSFDEVLHESSAGADLILMGMAEPDEDFAAYYEGLRARTAGLPATMFVLGAEEIGYGEVLK